ncbi:MAG: S8 family serine peptidase [Dehalococcoidia bacterium]
MSTGETFGVALDEGGRVVNEADFLEAEVQARSEKYGKLAPALYDLLAVSEEHAVLQVNVRVAFWPEPLDTSSIDRSDEGQAVVILSERQESKMLEILDSEAPLVAYLESQGVKVLHRDQLVPLVIAEATSSQIAEIAKRDDVAWIDQVYTHAPALNVSRNTVHAQYVNSAGYTGTGKKVAVVEAGGIRTDNSYLQGPITNRLSTCIGLEGNHQTQVAGVVSSDHSTYKGVAYNASLLGAASCDESYSDQSLMPPTIWSVIQGASVINNSWGRDSAGVATAMTRYQDDLVYTWRTSVVDSAGNIGTIPGSCPSTSPKVVSPGIAYNAITVGSFSDAGTWSSPSGWNDDSVASDSCYLDPVSTHSDRYKPEVGAPGVNITTTNGSGASTATVSGTSFAAPHVSAAVALLINRQSVLASQPEAVKAILMASAIHRPISGDASESNALYGEILGAGGIDLERADHIAYALTWSTATLFTNSFDWEGCRNYLLQRLRPRESEGRFDVDSTN